jgi:HPt (histidine-containing phosphotransfer) domain-containing protein
MNATQTLISSNAPLNLEDVVARCGGDLAFAAAVIEQFRTQATVDADRMAQAFAAGDLLTVQHSAHDLKSMSAYMTATTASKLAQQVELLARDHRLSDLPPLLTRLCAEIKTIVTWLTDHTPAQTPRPA